MSLRFRPSTSKPLTITPELPPYWLVQLPSGKFMAVFEDIFDLIDVDTIVPHFKGFETIDFGIDGAAFELGYMQ